MSNSAAFGSLTRSLMGGLGLCFVVATSAADKPETSSGSLTKPNPELGKQIYLQGTQSSGEPLRATVQGDILVEGIQVACVNCHRRSGYGSSEAGSVVPPILGSILYQPSRIKRGEMIRELYQEVQPRAYWGRVRNPRSRPAYTDETLARALRSGPDPAGRPLDALMPRYRLNDEDMGHLIAYLKTMTTDPPPGVEASKLHFATVVTEGSRPDKRKAMLDVIPKHCQENTSRIYCVPEGGCAQEVWKKCMNQHN